MYTFAWSVLCSVRKNTNVYVVVDSESIFNGFACIFRITLWFAISPPSTVSFYTLKIHTALPDPLVIKAK
jgi:hypothetical protein